MKYPNGHNSAISFPLGGIGTGSIGLSGAGQLIDWDEQPVLSALDLGSYNTTTDGSQRIAVQSCFAGCKIAIFDREDRLWRSLSS